MFTNEPLTPMTKRRATLLLSLLSCAMIARAGWEPLPPLPEPNGGIACGTLHGGIVIAGGTKWENGVKVWLDKIWWLDPKTLKWEAKGALPHALGYAVCGQWKDGLIIAGGFDGTVARDEVWHLTPAFELKRVGRLKTAVSIAQGVVCGDELIVVGGTSDPAKIDALVAKAQLMHLPDGTTKDIAAPSATPFGTAASTTTGSQLWIFGGVKHDPVNAVANLREAWAFDTGKSQWRALPPLPIATRGASAVALDDRHILIAGGYADDFTDKAFIHAVKSGAFTPSIPLPMPNCPTLVLCDGHVYALGGEPAKKVRTDKAWRIRVEELLKK
jgi:hypothetical protein